MRLLGATEVATLAAALPERYRSLVIVAAYTGLRWGELAGLRVPDLDLLRRRLTVRSALVEASGQDPQLGPPKSKASERTITLPGFVVETLDGTSRVIRRSTTWCGRPSEESCSAEGPLGGYGEAPWPNP